MSAAGIRRWLSRHRSALAWLWATIVIGLSLELSLFALLNRAAYGPGQQSGMVLLAIAAPFWAVIGAVIMSRTGNAVGWILLAVGTVMVGSPAAEEYIVFSTVTSPGSLPLIGVAARVGSTTMVLLWGIGMLFLLFPTGRVLSPRWRPVVWMFVAGAVLHSLGWQVRLDDGGRKAIPGAWENRGILLSNPLASPSLDWVWKVGVAIGLIASALAIVSLILRFRRAVGEERAQLRWLSLVGVLVAIAFVSGIAVPPLRNGNLTFVVMFLGLVFGIPLACAIAILKYRLYDIDVVIKKTVVVALLAAFITVVYVAIVAGIGSLFTRTLALQIVATAIVAIAFQPVRSRANRLANRLVYGKRATPYEVLARFAGRIGDTYASEDVVGRIAHVIADSTGSERTEVWLHLGDELRLTGAWPDAPARSVPLMDDELPHIEGDRIASVRHLGELLGAISITKPASEPLTPNEAELLDRLADQSGLVLANVRLTADLEARLDQIAQRSSELRASRQRIVAAQDEERRRLERNIHDGAQQHLVALAVKLRLARGMLEREAERGRAMLGEIAREIEAARDTIHALSLGVYPPHLEEEGIAAALASQYASSTLPVHIDADGLRRHPLDVEAAIYFCLLEGLQNAAKYANANRIDIRLHDDGDALSFAISDDGAGFDADANGNGTGLAGMRDRLAVFGGSAWIRSAPGRGTTVEGRVPIAEGVRA